MLLFWGGVTLSLRGIDGLLCRIGQKEEREGSVLNLTLKLAGSEVPRGRRVVLMSMPWARAAGGMAARNRRVARDAVEKGLNFVFTSVMNLVIILVGRLRDEAAAFYVCVCVCVCVGMRACARVVISGFLVVQGLVVCLGFGRGNVWSFPPV